QITSIVASRSRSRLEVGAGQRKFHRRHSGERRNPVLRWGSVCDEEDKAPIQMGQGSGTAECWIPAFAGMTAVGGRLPWANYRPSLYRWEASASTLTRAEPAAAPPVGPLSPATATAPFRLRCGRRPIPAGARGGHRGRRG